MRRRVEAALAVIAKIQCSPLVGLLAVCRWMRGEASLIAAREAIRQRETLTDQEFLDALTIPDALAPFAIRLRDAIAGHCCVAATSIRPDDSLTMLIRIGNVLESPSRTWDEVIQDVTEDWADHFSLGLKLPIIGTAEATASTSVRSAIADALKRFRREA
ncbi:MAG: hypothetical protein U0744_10670 [Gemmataceae bacterium]